MATSNQEFAQRVGCHVSTASRLKRGKKMPSTSMLIKISRAYEIPMDDLARAYSEGPDQLGDLIRDRIDALAARVTELETPPPPEPDEYQARLELNTASKHDRPQALANLNAAKARIRHQADLPAKEKP